MQSGDLTAGGFQLRDRAQLGTQGHKRVQRSRPEGYQAEVEIAYRVEGDDLLLEVQGRMDGLYPNSDAGGHRGDQDHHLEPGADPRAAQPAALGPGAVLRVYVRPEASTQ